MLIAPFDLQYGRRMIASKQPDENYYIFDYQSDINK